MAFCKDCAQWRKSTLEPNNEQIGVCQIDGKDKDDIRYSCVFFSQRKVSSGAVNFLSDKALDSNTFSPR